MATIRITAANPFLAGTNLSLSSYLYQTFSSFGFTQYSISDSLPDTTQGSWSNLSQNTTVFVNGIAQAQGSSVPIFTNGVGTCDFSLGYELWSGIWVQAYLAPQPGQNSGTWLQTRIAIVPAVYNDPTPGPPTASDVVGAAYALLAAATGTSSPNGCHTIVETIAAMAGAPLPLNSGSIDPNQNESGGFWTVVHRGSQNAIANWTALLQPGDIVRYDYADPAKSQHSFTVLSVNGALVQTIDNWNNVLNLHSTNFEALAAPTGVTIFRITESINTIYGLSGDDGLIGSIVADRIFGGLGNDFLAGGVGADVLLGDGGNDTINGGTENDYMAGGIGNDTYYIDGYGDLIIEHADQGTDLVYASISYALGSGCEQIILQGGSPVGALGNELDNSMIGNNANNGLAGGSGNDTILGQGGDDSIDGQLGADNMQGGAGIDTYFVDNVGDVVTETADATYDTIWTTLSYVLPANVEILIAKEGYVINGVGNNAVTLMLGNNAPNNFVSLGGNDIVLGLGSQDTIDGGTGNDLIAGGEGFDILTGGTGNDLFVFTSISDWGDSILDFTTTPGANLDLIDLRPMFAGFTPGFGASAASAITSGHLTLAQSGANTAIFVDANGGAHNAGEQTFLALVYNTNAATLGNYILVA
ncbi:MAG: calcium-binding protein [Bosea sp. (in: a-proteobacteria)]